MMNILPLRGFRIDWDAIESDSYLRDISAIAGCDGRMFASPVTFFTGENGSGKSTLLEALAVASGFNPEGGTRNYHFSTFDSHSELCDAMRLTRGAHAPKWGYFLRAESFYNVASAEDEYARGPGGVPEELHERSHGESFLFIAQKHFRANGLYFLDEPEAALSPQRQLTLLLEINRCAKEGSQFIIVTHSPILMGMPDAEIWSFDGDRLHTCAYEDTESFRITKLFVNDRQRLLTELLR